MEGEKFCVSDFHRGSAKWKVLFWILVQIYTESSLVRYPEVITRYPEVITRYPVSRHRNINIHLLLILIYI